MQNLLIDGYRIDGRQPSEIRHLKCRLAPFRQADGSSYIEQGGTKVLAAVYGPQEPDSENSDGECKINVEYAKSPFANIEHRIQRKNDSKSREISEKIRNTLSSAIVLSTYPRSVINVYLTVIESDGGDWAASINAAGLALVDAGIVLKDMIAACEVSVIDMQESTQGGVDEFSDDAMNMNEPENETNRTDPTAHEQDRCQALVDPNRDECIGYNIPKLSIAILPKLGKIIAIEVSGRLHLSRLEVGLETAKKGAHEMADIFDGMVKNHLTGMNEMQN